MCLLKYNLKAERLPDDRKSTSRDSSQNIENIFVFFQLFQNWVLLLIFRICPKPYHHSPEYHFQIVFAIDLTGTDGSGWQFGFNMVFNRVVMT